MLDSQCVLSLVGSSVNSVAGSFFGCVNLVVDSVDNRVLGCFGSVAY